MVETYKPENLTAFKNVVDSVKKMLGDPYDLKEQKEDYALLEYYDPYDREFIELSYEVNSFGVMRYTVKISEFNQNNDEIITSDSFGCLWDCFDPDMEDNETYHEQLEYIESDQPDKDISEWENKKSISVNGFGEYIEFNHIVDSFVCYNNITHYHTVKGYSIEINLPSIEPEKVNAFIRYSDLFLRIFQLIAEKEI